MNWTPHEIKILVTDSCLHSSSTGLKALSSFISCISKGNGEGGGKGGGTGSGAGGSGSGGGAGRRAWPLEGLDGTCVMLG